MRGLNRHRPARILAAGRAFVQNARRGHYDIATDTPAATGSAPLSTTSHSPSDRRGIPIMLRGAQRWHNATVPKRLRRSNRVPQRTRQPADASGGSPHTASMSNANAEISADSDLCPSQAGSRALQRARRRHRTKAPALPAWPPGIMEVLRRTLVSGLRFESALSNTDVIQLRVGEESADNIRAAAEPFEGSHGDSFQLIAGQRHDPRYLVVLDVLVHPFVGVQLG